MKIVEYKMHQFIMRLKQPYRFASYEYRTRPINILMIKDELGNIGLGEVEAFEFPNYVDEIQSQCVRSINTRIMPLLGGKNYDTPFEFSRFINSMNGPKMASAAVEMAVWDLFSKRNNVSFQQLLFSTIGQMNNLPAKVEVGVAIGIHNNSIQMIDEIQKQIDKEYNRIKLKINRGTKISDLVEIRRHFPKVLMMIDCNSQFGLRDKSFFQSIDNLDFAMIEQPFGKKDFKDHAKLQSIIRTPICLDENILTSDDVMKVFNKHSGQYVNMKIARVGGVSNALAMTNLAIQNGLKVWCGGMLETGVGRAFNLAFASLPFFKFPGDISASDRYYINDITEQSFTINNGEMSIPQGDGIGVNLSQMAQIAFDNEEWINLG
ncbi:o-succinylbenzoate synthase [Lactobacillus salsicarnum]|nr:o-succinylbenzoate synthase [Companilactobacillus mishanensis]